MSNTTEKKVTKKEMFNRIMVAMAENEEIVAFCQREIELLDKKSSKSGDSKKKAENEKVKAQIVEILTNSETPMTVGQLMVALNNGFSNQRVSALLTQLKGENTVERTVEKRVAYFSIKETE